MAASFAALGLQTPVDSTGVQVEYLSSGLQVELKINLVDSGGLHKSQPEFVGLEVRVRVRIGLEAI